MARPVLSTALLAALALALPATAVAKPADRNRDSIPDRWERAHQVSTHGKRAARKDRDRDGLSAWAEWRSGTDPRRADSDRDGQADGLEDRDRDGLPNGFEIAAGTDPGSADSDRDRRRDGREDADRDGLDNAAELRFGFAPRRRDSDGDGILDGRENPGVVKAAGAGSVTIALARGGTLTAALGEDADLGCDTDPSADDDGPTAEPEDPADDDAGDDPADDGGDDDSGDDLDEDDDATATASAAATQDAADDSPDADEDEDGQGPDEDACAPEVRPGALVHSAEVSRAPGGGLVFDVLELLAR